MHSRLEEILSGRLPDCADRQEIVVPGFLDTCVLFVYVPIFRFEIQLKTGGAVWRKPLC